MITRREMVAGGAFQLPAAGQAPQEKIGAAVLGIGHAHAAGKVIALANSPAYRLAGVSEPDVRLPRTHKAYEQVRWLAPDQILEDRSIEVVAIETGVADNLRYARMCIDANKHIHLDKPPGTDLDQLRSLLADAAQRKLQVQMGYQWRYHTAINAALEAARSGWLGHVYMVRTTINQMLSAGDRTALAAFRGGFLFELGCHLIDRVVDLLGKPVKMRSILRHDAPAADTLVDNALAILEYDRAMAEIYIAAMQPHGNDYRSFEVLGTNGTFGVHIIPPYRALVDLRQEAGPYRAGVQHPEIAPREGLPFTPDFAELARVIRGEAAPSWSPEKDLIAQQVLLTVCGYISNV